MTGASQATPENMITRLNRGVKITGVEFFLVQSSLLGWFGGWRRRRQESLDSLSLAPVVLLLLQWNLNLTNLYLTKSSI